MPELLFGQPFSQETHEGKKLELVYRQSQPQRQLS